ncbi:ectonucleotide pyrophosphatase/phosphodiesterase family member 5 [Salmo salar]|uniref:Ectonucleotide pyrophosphatase/phosphodiesterase family member 5 n=1 Tax=Salmo salar TaxID=8030 RepID=A0ABM3F1K1_SALSA|nr:ectonucleotide pyrophosphatase/phosphodiesterase family member 5 [Salmo salar]XP_045577186.1 ectonucleotide pyrophosphatase/phosphodiesterase family member 5 [Salmo salar]XP_045577187.1 ectonucleotide pyrophosphatase/phosphodiesterase family member 5 [Salmo salar]XP_045577188.1 ectonucleotide pyrophosphatase/phosphodiesterase family member 5 [Salmo salar]
MMVWSVMLGCSSRRGGGCYLGWLLTLTLTLPLASLQMDHHGHQGHPLHPHQQATRGARPKLLLLSFDGFRWDYVDRVPTPNFHALMEEGSIVEQVENAYITKTYPDHYTLVTGLHAETHGIVGNEMYDPDLNASFSMETPSAYEPRWWAGAEPLWVTNQKQGGRSGGVMWPGSDVEIGGAYPSRYLPYNASLSFERRVETMVAWLMGERPGGGVRSVQGGVDFGVLYWEEPDESGHRLGPENPLMDAVIADIDDKLGFLRNELRKNGLYESVNLIVTSDHGMTQLSKDKVIELDQYLDRDLYTWVDKSPVVGILPREGKLEEVYSALVEANPNMVVYRREQIPERLHYRHNNRIMPIIIEAKEGWTITQNRTTGPHMLGNHGYDNTLPSMHPVLVARGPAFRQDYVKSSMRSVDLYPLMCHILSVRPRPNNGSLDRVRDLLSEPAPPTRSAPLEVRYQPSFDTALGVVLGVVMVTGFLVVIVKQMTLRQLPSRQSEMAQPLLLEELQL